MTTPDEAKCIFSDWGGHLEQRSATKLVGCLDGQTYAIALVSDLRHRQWLKRWAVAHAVAFVALEPHHVTLACQGTRDSLPHFGGRHEQDSSNQGQMLPLNKGPHEMAERTTLMEAMQSIWASLAQMRDAKPWKTLEYHRLYADMNHLFDQAELVADNAKLAYHVATMALAALELEYERGKRGEARKHYLPSSRLAAVQASAAQLLADLRSARAILADEPNDCGDDAARPPTDAA